MLVTDVFQFSITCYVFPSFCRYWQTREQRVPPPTKGKPAGKGVLEDQEQQDPLEFLQSDDDEEETPPEEEKSSGGGAARRRLQEQRERLHGAMALIELANNLSP